MARVVLFGVIALLVAGRGLGYVHGEQGRRRMLQLEALLVVVILVGALAVIVLT